MLTHVLIAIAIVISLGSCIILSVMHVYAIGDPGLFSGWSFVVFMIVIIGAAISSHFQFRD